MPVVWLYGSNCGKETLKMLEKPGGPPFFPKGVISSRAEWHAHTASRFTAQVLLPLCLYRDHFDSGSRDTHLLFSNLVVKASVEVSHLGRHTDGVCTPRMAQGHRTYPAVSPGLRWSPSELCPFAGQRNSLQHLLPRHSRNALIRWTRGDKQAGGCGRAGSAGGELFLALHFLPAAALRGAGRVGTPGRTAGGCVRLAARRRRKEGSRAKAEATGSRGGGEHGAASAARRGNR